MSSIRICLLCGCAQHGDVLNTVNITVLLLLIALSLEPIDATDSGYMIAGAALPIFGPYLCKAKLQLSAVCLVLFAMSHLTTCNLAESSQWLSEAIGAVSIRVYHAKAWWTLL